jgi:hypothetical protein
MHQHSNVLTPIGLLTASRAASGWRACNLAACQKKDPHNEARIALALRNHILLDQRAMSMVLAEEVTLIERLQP